MKKKNKTKTTEKVKNERKAERKKTKHEISPH